jgi:hypothetical protein
MDILPRYAYNKGLTVLVLLVFLYSLNCSVSLGRYMIGWKGEIDVEFKQFSYESDKCFIPKGNTIGPEY